MSKAEMGGPAFPEQRRVIRAGYETKEFEPCSGMTLRDYFAAEALGSYTANHDLNVAIRDGKITTDFVAASCYEWADAMLKARKP